MKAKVRWIKRLFGCDRRAKDNLLSYYRWRVARAETAEELMEIADQAIRDGVISEVEALLDAKRLVECEAAALALYRDYRSGDAV